MEYKLNGENAKKRTIHRDMIEEAIKTTNIDRNRFHEFSKFKYDEIIRNFYYTFSDHNHHHSSIISLTAKSLHFKDNLDSYVAASFYMEQNSWTDYLNFIKNRLPLNGDGKMYFIVSEGWVYEGYKEEMFQVLSETDVWIADFFIVSSKFDWFVAHDNIDECASLYQKRK